MSDKREPKFWSGQEPEILTHEEIDEAVEEVLDDCDVLPETITINGYAPMGISLKLHADRVLDDLLEMLCEEYGDPDAGKYPDKTPGMIAASEAFCAAVANSFPVWACEVVCEKTIEVMPWVKANRPDWLEPPPGQ